MTEPAISLMPVRAEDLAVGKPVPRALYDWHGKLLFDAGRVIESQSQLDGLLDKGFVDDSDSHEKGGDARSNPAQAQGTTDNKETIAGMDEIRWRIGEVLYLQPADNATLRYTVRLIGFARNKTVFVSAPAIGGKFEFVRDGQMFIVRAFSGKKAYAFSAAAVKSVHSPHPYLHLSYPKEVRCTVVRRGVRAKVNLIASVSGMHPDRVAAAALSDLSLGGASGLMKQALGRKGDQGRIKFRVDAAGQDECLNLRMVLRSVVPAENGEGFKHGFEFLDISIHERLILSAFVHQTLAEGE